MLPPFLWLGYLTLHTRVGSLPALLLLPFSWQQEHLFQVKDDKMCFLGSLESRLSPISTPALFDISLVIGSCFLATDPIWPTEKEDGSFQGVGWSVADNESRAVFLGTLWEPGDKAAACAGVDLALLLLLLSRPSALVKLLSQTTAEQSRAPLFYYSRASLLSLHVRACWGLFRITNTGKVKKIQSAVSSSHQNTWTG